MNTNERLQNNANEILTRTETILYECKQIKALLELLLQNIEKLKKWEAYSESQQDKPQ